MDASINVFSIGVKVAMGYFQGEFDNFLNFQSHEFHLKQKIPRINLQF